jgi:hypothetical protein
MSSEEGVACQGDRNNGREEQVRLYGLYRDGCPDRHEQTTPMRSLPSRRLRGSRGLVLTRWPPTIVAKLLKTQFTLVQPPRLKNRHRLFRVSPLSAIVNGFKPFREHGPCWR